MRASFRLCQTFVWWGIFVPLATCVTEATAAILSVSTTAQLQQAIANAQPGDTIVLAPGVYRPSARLEVLVDLTIQGDASAPTVVDGGGNSILRVLGNNVRLENLTFRNGSTAISLDSRGALVINRVTITGNTRHGVTGDSGDVTIVNSTIAGNVNTQEDPASGIEISCATLTLRHVTISGNDRGLNIFFPCGDAFSVQNALIVGNGQDCVADGDYTLDGATSFDSDGTCRAAVTTPASSAFTTVLDPGVGPLADNGGPMMTMALSASSPAVDAGSSCTEVFDQRAAIRSDARCDVGAFERSPFVIMASATGAGTVRIGTNAGTLFGFHPIAEANMPNQPGKPAGVTFPYGFFQWSIEMPAAGGAADVEFLFPSAVPTPVQYWKVISGVWTNVCLQLPCIVNGNRLTITFRDGDIGDLDGIVNAVIADPGGLGSGRDSIDATPPKLHCDSPNGAWHADDARIACTASDEGSGLANADDASFSLSTHVDVGIETSDSQTNSRQVCDVAGNCATAGPVGGNRVDKKAPTIVISAPMSGDVYLLNASTPTAYACSDGGSGIASCSGSVPSGADIPTGTVGSMTFAVNAIDHVGHPASATATYAVTFGTCLLYDRDVAKKSGSTYPIKLQLCDAAGRNVSSPSIVVHATGIAQTSTNALGPLDDSGNANPDFDFRYDESLAGYIFNLKTTGLTTGTYNLNFTAGSDPVVHSAPFAVK
jgi:hypothetical protein